MAWTKLGSTTLSGAAANTSWKLLARGTGSGTTVDTGTFTAKDNIMVLGYSSNGTQYVRYNNDTGSNYANRRNEEGGTDSAQTSQTSISFTRNAGEDLFFVGDLVNIAAQEKLGVYQQVSQNSAGAGNAPKRQEWAHKWANTSDQITRVTMTSDSGNYSSDDEIVVLGYDNDEADSGTNFWQELASVESTGDNHTTGTFTAKKYLMVETCVIASGGECSQRLTFNDDTSSNYAARISFDGGSDSTQTNGSNINSGLNDNIPSGSIAKNTMFIINKSDKEKLAISHGVVSEASGASTAPTRDELVFKWANTSSQITKIDFDNNKAGDWASGSYIKVYGAD